MPGTHITDQQSRLYVHHRRTNTRQIAAARAAFFGDSFIVAGAIGDAARWDLLDVNACAAAKRAFTGAEGTR